VYVVVLNVLLEDVCYVQVFTNTIPLPDRVPTTMEWYTGDST